MKRIGVKSPTVADGIDSIQTVESAYVTAENHQLQETSMWIIHEYFKSMYAEIYLKKIASCFWKSPETIGRNPESAHVLKFETQDSKTSHQKMELRHFETPFCNIQSEFSSIVHSVMLWSDLFVPVFLKKCTGLLSFHSYVPFCYNIHSDCVRIINAQSKPMCQ